MIGVEVDVIGPSRTARSEARGIPVAWRADRLERDPAGREVIVDIKTGKTPVSRTMPAHAQLAMYQLAVAGKLGARRGRRPGGARLVCCSLASGAAGVAERKQDPTRTGRATAQPRPAAAAATAGPSSSLGATAGAHCPLRPGAADHVREVGAMTNRGTGFWWSS